MTTPHKWAKEIKAWADGGEIEYRIRMRQSGWSPWRKASPNPHWTLHWTLAPDYEYRVKPEKKPDVVVATWIEQVIESSSQEVDVQSILDQKENINCSFTFDGETGKLKAVQLLSPSLDRS